MSADAKQELKRLAIGKKIRALREEQGIGLSEMADRAGIQEVLLSQVEADVVAPTVATLINISRILGTGIDYFFTDQAAPQDIEIVRADERRVIAAPSHKRNAPLIYSYVSLSPHMAGKHMEPFLVEFSLDVDESNLAPQAHAGEEFIFILEGDVEFITADRRAMLRSGDSLYFHSKTPHILRGVGRVKPRALAVLYPFES
jgi:transcriptional regulator with XRE-family HTH domain